MSSYRTVPSWKAIRNGETVYIGQSRTMTARKLIKPGLFEDSIYVYEGDVFVVKNIIYCINYETDIFICCEFERDINGHKCSASRGPDGGLWDEQFLCKNGHGEYMTLKECVRITQMVNLEPTWEV